MPKIVAFLKKHFVITVVIVYYVIVAIVIAALQLWSAQYEYKAKIECQRLYGQSSELIDVGQKACLIDDKVKLLSK